MLGVGLAVGGDEVAPVAVAVVVAVHGEEEQHLVARLEFFVPIGQRFGDVVFFAFAHIVATEAIVAGEHARQFFGFPFGKKDVVNAGLEVGDVEEYGVVGTRAGLGRGAEGKAAEEQEAIFHIS